MDASLELITPDSGAFITAPVASPVSGGYTPDPDNLARDEPDDERDELTFVSGRHSKQCKCIGCRTQSMSRVDRGSGEFVPTSSHRGRVNYFTPMFEPAPPVPLDRGILPFEVDNPYVNRLPASCFKRPKLMKECNLSGDCTVGVGHEVTCYDGPTRSMTKFDIPPLLRMPLHRDYMTMPPIVHRVLTSPVITEPDSGPSLLLPLEI